MRTGATAFKVLFLMAPGALMIVLARKVRALPYAELVVVGRRSGAERRIVITLFELDGRWYVGHPNGRSQWVRNLLAADSAVLVRANGSTTVRPIELSQGAEREAVIRATSRQPFPANIVYRAGRSHIRDVGCYLRLERNHQ